MIATNEFARGQHVAEPRALSRALSGMGPQVALAGADSGPQSIPQRNQVAADVAARMARWQGQFARVV